MGGAHPNSTYFNVSTLGDVSEHSSSEQEIRRPAQPQCPVDTAMGVLSGRWKGSILWRLHENGSMRPGELRREIPGVSEAVLLRQLAELVDDGLVVRIDRGTWPLHVSYEISGYGATAGPLVEQLCAWGRAHQARSGVAGER